MNITPILSEAKNLIVSISQKIEILRLTPQNDIMTHPHRGEGRVRGESIKGRKLCALGIV